jgi:tetratricopeptide (TPR) repeat protein
LEAIDADRVSDSRIRAICYEALGDVHVRLSEYQEARARYEEAQPIYRAIGARLGEANCIKALGDVSLEEGDDTAALAAYQDAFERYMALGLPYAAGGVLTSQTSIYDRRKEYGLSLPLHTQAIDLAPANPMWYRNRALCYINLKDSAHALTDLEIAARLQPDHPYLHLRRGDVALLQKEYAAAARHYTAFTDVLSRNTAGYYGLAKAYFGQRRTEEALASLRRALELTYSRQEVVDAIDDLIEIQADELGWAGIDQGVALLRAWLAQRGQPDLQVEPPGDEVAGLHSGAP